MDLYYIHNEKKSRKFWNKKEVGFPTSTIPQVWILYR